MTRMTLHTLRYELLVLARNKRARLFTIAFPIVLLVVLSSLGGDSDGTTFDGDRISVARFMLPGVLTMATVSACFAAMVNVVVARRQSGVLQRRRTTPVPAGVLVASQCLATTLLAVLSSTVLLVVGRVGFDVGISASGIAVMALVVVVGGLCLCAVGLLVSSVVPSLDAAQPVVQLVMFPVLFVSGVWFTRDDFPSWLRDAGDVLPVAPLSDALHTAAGSGALDLGDLAVVAVWGVAAAFLATRRFSWMPAREAT